MGKCTNCIHHFVCKTIKGKLENSYAETCVAYLNRENFVAVVHGRWEEIGVADYKCSRCGFRFTSADPISMFEYCRCGAKMDGE